MPTALPEVRTSEVSGVRVYSAEVPGPLRVNLKFRVGRADEPLHLAGITHLVEHLALWNLRGGGLPFNGSVEALETTFWASGTQAEIHQFLEHVTKALSALPMERLAAEKSVLRAEAGLHGGESVGGTLLRLRYGAQGCGRLGFDEFGLFRVSADEVMEWAKTWFTTENAVVWLSGAVPEGLSLTLPPGVRQPLPRSMPRNMPLPSHAEMPYAGAAISCEGTRSLGLISATQILQRRAQERLRHQAAVAYEVGRDYLPVSVDRAHVYFVVGCEPGAVRPVVTGLYASARDLAADGPTAAEMAELRDAKRRREDPLRAIGWLNRLAHRYLEGLPMEDSNEVQAEDELLKADDCAAAWRNAMTNLILLTPPGIAAPSVSLNPYPEYSPIALTGKTLRYVSGREFDVAPKLTVSKEGLSLVLGDHTRYTARFAECAVVLRYSDGSRTMIDESGLDLAVNVDEWREAEYATAAVDAAVPAARHVALPSDRQLGRTVIPPDRRRVVVRQPLIDRQKVITLAVYGLVGVACFVVAAILSAQSGNLRYAGYLLVVCWLIAGLRIMGDLMR
jgi:hypothetical protein